MFFCKAQDKGLCFDGPGKFGCHLAQWVAHRCWVPVAKGAHVGPAASPLWPGVVGFRVLVLVPPKRQNLTVVISVIIVIVVIMVIIVIVVILQACK